MAPRRSHLEWLYPGLGMKRRVLAVCAGGALVGLSGWLALGIVVSSGRRHDVGGTWITGHVWLVAALVAGCLLAGLAVVVAGTRSLYRFARSAGEQGVLALRSDARLARGPRIVAIGGGTGLSVLLSGLKEHSSNLTAVVTVADDGGSSGLLRNGLGMLPPGDIRSCLVALADDESLMSRLFQYRFPQDGGLQGHNFGNLFVAALADVTGDFERAVQESTTVLNVRGRVLPATLESVTLHAELQGGERRLGLGLDSVSAMPASGAVAARVRGYRLASPKHRPGRVRDVRLHLRLVLRGRSSWRSGVRPAGAGSCCRSAWNLIAVARPPAPLAAEGLGGASRRNR